MAAVLEGGFKDAPRDASHAFRGLMTAMARPGTCVDVAGAVPPAPLSVAAGVVLLTLCDPDTPVYLAGAFDCDDVRTWLAFHTGAPISTAQTCAFALGSWDDLNPLEAYPVGTAQYPDRSATLIVERQSLVPSGVILTGPGIERQAALNLPDPAALAANHRLFPLGLDFIFTAGSQVAALPRSTRIG